MFFWLQISVWLIVIFVFNLRMIRKMSLRWRVNKTQAELNKWTSHRFHDWIVFFFLWWSTLFLFKQCTWWLNVCNLLCKLPKCSAWGCQLLCRCWNQSSGFSKRLKSRETSWDKHVSAFDHVLWGGRSGAGRGIWSCPALCQRLSTWINGESAEMLPKCDVYTGLQDSAAGTCHSLFCLFENESDYFRFVILSVSFVCISVVLDVCSVWIS